MGKVVANGKATPEPVIDPFDRLDAAEVVHFIRDRLTALTNALQVIRVVAGDDPHVSAALDMADRQAKALAGLTELHDQGER